MKDFGTPDKGFAALPILSSRRAVYEATAPIVGEGDWAEFGFRNGGTARVLIPLMRGGAKFYAFDSFQGLPIPWDRGGGEVIPAGHFKCAPPQIEGATIVPGLFSESVPAWLQARSAPLALIHIDCDLYESTCDVLDHMRYGHELVAGSVIVIDDLCSYPNWRSGVWKAIGAWLSRSGANHTWLARGKGHGSLILVT